MLGPDVRAQGVDAAVGGRAVRAERPLGRVYVEVVPSVGHLLAAGPTSPEGRAAQRHGEHLVVGEPNRHARHRTCEHRTHAGGVYTCLALRCWHSWLREGLAFSVGRVREKECPAVLLAGKWARDARCGLRCIWMMYL